MDIAKIANRAFVRNLVGQHACGLIVGDSQRLAVWRGSCSVLARNWKTMGASMSGWLSLFFAMIVPLMDPFVVQTSNLFVALESLSYFLLGLAVAIYVLDRKSTQFDE